MKKSRITAVCFIGFICLSFFGCSDFGADLPPMDPTDVVEKVAECNEAGLIGQTVTRNNIVIWVNCKIPPDAN
jgi:hypothetical protein